MPNKLFRFCPKCGHPVKPGTRFCPHCGHDMMSNQNYAQSNNYQQRQSAPMQQYPHQYHSSNKLGISIIAAVIILLIGGAGGYIYHEHNMNTYLSNKQQNSTNQNNTNTTQNNNQNNNQNTAQNSTSSNSNNSGSTKQDPEQVKATLDSYWHDVESVANQYGSASDNRSALASYFVDGANNDYCHSMGTWAANLTSNVKIKVNVKSIHFDGKYADVTSQVDYDFYGGHNDRSQGFIWHSKMIGNSRGSYKFITTKADNDPVYDNPKND